MLRRIIITACMMAALACAHADLPFRQHRFDSFKALEIGPDNIVFLGNSITNMHPWAEALGNPLIVNRGTSGALSGEIIDNIETFVHGRPAKLFLMIGTNDLGTAGFEDPALVAANVETLIDLVIEKSPETEIYVQSILPSSVGLRTIEAEQAANQAIRQICESKGITYIDLWDDMDHGIADGSLSLDGLHLTASGYRLWCEKIAPLAGGQCAYAKDQPDLAYGFNNSYGMRNSYFAKLPLMASDVVFFGDEMVHGCEWNELLHCPAIKNRGLGWGYNSLGIKDLIKCVPAVLEGNGGKQAPAKIFLYAGAVDAAAGTRAASMMADYKTLARTIRNYAPETMIYAVSLAPMSSSSSYNAYYVRPFNAQLKAWADAEPGVEYVDIYTALSSGNSAMPEYVRDNYLTALGYARVSETLAPLLAEEGAAPTTVERACQLTDIYNGAGDGAQSAIADAAATCVLYDLAGRPVLRPGHGLYVGSSRKLVLRK